MPIRIDLNADLGEGFGHWTSGDDEALLSIVTSANIACGFHAGDPLIMRRVCAQSVERGVAIGAQVGYRDLVGFGRRRIEIAPAELTADLLYQLGALDGFARAAGDRVRYLKPHGALYNTAVTDPVQAQAIVDALLAWNTELPVLTLPGSRLAVAAADAGLPVIVEAFADRGYRADGTLQPRDQPAAVIHDPAAIAERSVRLALTGELAAVDGSILTVQADSLCVHGDTPGAVAIARAVRDVLTAAGVELARFN
ncbi:MAG: LamB/YcsF family protein [Actinomycetota bacterium]|nr:LamB/YcsF family protein [Actinomycetota bacterium]MDQ2956206.1 LamB/YcsF family protein [Actinomycetota bacterium]